MLDKWDYLWKQRWILSEEHSRKKGEADQTLATLPGMTES